MERLKSQLATGAATIAANGHRVGWRAFRTVWFMPALGVILLVLIPVRVESQTQPRADQPRAAANEANATERVPPPLTEYLGRQIAPTMHFTGAEWLVRESRDREEDCRTMLGQLKVQPGMVICDMGCGNGFYTLQLAKMVGPKGKVLAVDIQPEMLRILQARAAEDELRNVELILGTETDPKLPAESLDMILCVDVYHEFSHPQHMLAAMHKALKPDGRLVLLEFRAEDALVPIKPLHKMSKAQVLKEMTANGFELDREFDELPWQHMLFYRKQSDAADGG